MVSDESNITQNQEKISTESSQATTKKEILPMVKIPKWFRIILMFIPALVIAGIILLIDHYIGFPSNIFPTAIIALIGSSLFGIIVIGDLVYRNFFTYKMLRKASTRSKVYKEFIKEKKAQKEAKKRFDYEEATTEDEYQYDEDAKEKGILVKTKGKETNDEYSYEIEEDQEYYRMKSYIVRGGIITILIVNAVLLLLIALIAQIFYGGFSTT